MSLPRTTRIALASTAIACAVALLSMLPGFAHAGVGYERTPLASEIAPGRIMLGHGVQTSSPHRSEGLLVEVESGTSIAGADRLSDDGEFLQVDVDPAAAAATEAELERLPGVAEVERDVRMEFFGYYSTRTTNDPLRTEQWSLSSMRWYGSRVMPRIPVIAMLDSGIDASHPEFAGAVSNGNPKIHSTYNATNGTADVNDQLGHGTATASIAAAQTNNGNGIVGVAPDARIMSIKVGGLNGLDMSDAIRGLNWAVDNGAHVVNMSFGAPEYSRIFHRAILRAHNRGVVIVAATGNEGCAAENGYNDLNYPAGYPHVIGVGATDSRKRVSCYSNWGPEVDLVAPGTDVVVAVPRGQSTTGYKTYSGTSFSSPAVAGAAAIIKAHNPSWSGDAIGHLLMRTAEDLQTRGWDLHSGYGLVNINAASRASRSGFFDRGEGDDDVFLARTNRAFFSKRTRHRRVVARIMRHQDPEDLWRVHLRKGDRVKARVLTQSYGKYRLRVFKPWTETINPRSRRELRQSLLPVSNRGNYRRPLIYFRARQTGWHYFNVSVAKGGGYYRLEAKRKRG